MAAAIAEGKPILNQTGVRPWVEVWLRQILQVAEDDYRDPNGGLQAAIQTASAIAAGDIQAVEVSSGGSNAASDAPASTMGSIRGSATAQLKLSQSAPQTAVQAETLDHIQVQRDPNGILLSVKCCQSSCCCPSA